jgi:signal transduction histidine kinase
METISLLRWIRTGGFIACVLAGVSAEVGNWTPDKPRAVWWVAASLLARAVQGLLFLRVTRRFPPGAQWPRTLFAMQLALSTLLESDASIVNALAVPLVVPKERRLTWLWAALGVMAINFALFVAHQLANAPAEARNKLLGWELAGALAAGYLQVLLWGLVAYFAATLIVKMEEDKRQLVALNAELVSSRAMLADRSRLAERLEIARELHDTLGHHLTTLNLELEIAQHSPTEREAQVGKAQFLARLLLADLRDTVTSWRRELTGGLPEALRCLAAGVSLARVDLKIAEDLPALPPEAAHSLLRCAQEGVTNALRHGAAARIQVDLRQEGGSIELLVADDGRGCQQITRGNGLAGIVTRAREHGGDAEFASSAAGGFRVRVWMPVPDGAAA